jgi:hypothetical protein
MSSVWRAVMKDTGGPPVLQDFRRDDLVAGFSWSASEEIADQFQTRAVSDRRSGLARGTSLRLDRADTARLRKTIRKFVCC